MSLTTDLPPQKFEYESTSGNRWNMDSIAVATDDTIPNNTISIDFANGYTKGKDDMRAKIEAAIKEINQIYCGQYCENPKTADDVREEAIDIIRRYIGG